MQETLSPKEIAVLRLQAAEGDAVLQYKLGCFFKLFPKQGKPREFHEWLARAAQHGHADACWELAEAYLMEDLLPADYAQAHQWLKLGAELNQVNCLYNLGVQYAHGSGVAKNERLAIDFTRRSAELGDPPSLYNMVMFHAKGIGVPKDLSAALPWAEKLAATGDERGLPMLEYIQSELQSRSVTINLSAEQAGELTRQIIWQQMQELQADRVRHAKAVANPPPPPEPSAEEKLLRRAQAGDSAAQLQLAKTLREAMKLDESAQWLTKAAQNGHPEGEFQLGNCYLKGMGVSRDYSKAQHWYALALSHGHKHAQQALDSIAAQRAKFLQNLQPLQEQANAGDPQAQYQLALRYGDDAIQDFPQVARLMHLAAQQGHAAAQFALFTMHSKGQGVDRNPEQALQWLLSSASRKHPDAVRFFMRRYAEREVDPQQFPRAAAVFADNRFLFPEYQDPYAPVSGMAKLQNAAFQGDLPSLYLLALAYCEGQGITLDLERGIKMLQKAAERNFPAAQEELARRYGVGEGVSRDLEKGRDLALKALKQGRVESRFMLVTLFQVPLDEIDRLLGAMG
jgi:TPR repeat protein